MFTKGIKSMLKRNRVPYQAPKRTQDIIPISRVYKDGIFEVGNKFSKNYIFRDINYQVASEETKVRFYELYADLLMAFECNTVTKLTIYNRRQEQSKVESMYLMPLKNDGLDDYRCEYNRLIMDSFGTFNGRRQEKYITVSVFADGDVDVARKDFQRIETKLKQRFNALGSTCEAMGTVDRLSLLHDFYRKDSAGSFDKSLSALLQDGYDVRDAICPQHYERKADHLIFDGQYARVFYIKGYASWVRDDFISFLTSLNLDMMLSIDVTAIETDEAVRAVKRIVMGTEQNLATWQRRQNLNQNYSASIPYEMAEERDSARDCLRRLEKNDQRIMNATVTIVLTADSKEQLDADSKTLMTNGDNRSFSIVPLKHQQTDALQSVLPIGEWRIETNRTLETQSLAIFIPFRVQEIMDKGGVFYGENTESHNPILVDKQRLLNQSSIITGIPGSGKSVCAKWLALYQMLNSEDDVLIFDPEGEYARLANAMGDMATVVHIAAGGHDRLNTMEMEVGYGDEKPIVAKSQFIMSLAEQINVFSGSRNTEINAKHNSVIDRCVQAVYEDASKTGIVPTLSRLREELMKESEKEAQDLALCLELYTIGTLDIFGHETNVDLSKRVLVFDVHDLGEQLKPIGLLVITDTILNRVIRNWRQGKRTHVIIDEYHIVMSNPYSAQFFINAWRQFRKRNAYPTAITQNVDYILHGTADARTMLSNSEFVVMFNQSDSDRAELSRLLHLSEEQMRYVRGAEAGKGLIKYGNSIVPFSNIIPTDSKIFALVNTKPELNIGSFTT